MPASFKKSKILFTVLALASFFSFSGVVSAQSATDNTANIAQCVTTAIVSNIAQNLVTAGVIEGAAAAGGGGAFLTGAAGSLISPKVPIISTTADALSGATVGLTNAVGSFQSVFKMDLDATAYATGQCILTELTNSTVRWIQGGFNGNPKFAVDTTKLFQDISAGVLEDFSNQIKNLQACDFTPNFKYDLANSVQLSAPARNKIPAKIACPFGPMNVTASQFYAGTSQVFSWALFETALSDNGNQFAVKMITAEEAARRQAEAKAKEDQKLSWSNGFADIVDTANCPKMPPDIQSAITASETGGLAGTELSPGQIKFYQKQYCETTTPGKMIEGQLTKSLGIQMDRLGFADNMNKIVGALIDQLTKQALAGVFKRL